MIGSTLRVTGRQGVAACTWGFLMIRRVLTMAALALAVFGVSVPLAQAAPAAPLPISFGHEQGRFEGVIESNCHPVVGCSRTLTGTLRTAGGAADCYQAQYYRDGSRPGWRQLTERVCGTGQAEGTVSWGLGMPALRAYRVCRVTAEGAVVSCGPDAKA